MGAMAVRLDCFLDKPTNLYGKAFRDQVEERLSFFKDGKVPSKNIEVMNKIRMQIDIDQEDDDESMEQDEDIDLEVKVEVKEEKVEKKKKKKKKKDKKRKL